MIQQALIQQAADGDFIASPALLGIFLILAVISAVFWYNTHCPNCKRVFTRELMKTGKAGRLPTVINSKQRRSYRCKHCQHEWEKDVWVD